MNKVESRIGELPVATAYTRAADWASIAHEALSLAGTPDALIDRVTSRLVCNRARRTADMLLRAADAPGQDAHIQRSNRRVANSLLRLAADLENHFLDTTKMDDEQCP